MNSSSISQIRNDFPFFKANPQLAYLDNSATSQIPSCVIERRNRYDLLEKASPLRGFYSLSEKATADYEHARDLIRDFIGAASSREIIFTRNATESLNLAAGILGDSLIRQDDEILIGIAEHHSNLLPWRRLAARTGASIRMLPCSQDGEYSPDVLKNMLTEKTRLLAVTQMSNIFGRLNDIKTLCNIAHANHTLVVVDGCQSVPHFPVNVCELNVDFLAFSGHKMLSPSGIGVLYGREALLEQLPPYMVGGEMVDHVTEHEMTCAPLPWKYEAGTVNVGGAIALGEAVCYYNRIGFPAMMAREATLTAHLLEGISRIPHVHVIGSTRPEDHHGIIAFTMDDIHPHDIAAIMSENGVAIRAGRHCAHPLHDHLKISATARASLMFYNTDDEIEKFLDILSQTRSVMGYAD